nr:type II CAAX endopeptidase family protein [Sedimentibacter sp.]
MGKYDKSDTGVNSVSEDAIGDNPQSGIPIPENNNQISILNAIFSNAIYISIYALVGSVIDEPAGDILNWITIMFYVVFAMLFFYALKNLSHFSFEIFENIMLKNIVIAFFCSILVFSVNYAVNLLVLKNIFESLYDILVDSHRYFLTVHSFFIVCFLAPIGEELLFRGYILKGLWNKHGTVAALLISTVLFAVSHVNIVSATNAFIMGIVFGLLYIKRGSVFSCMLAHIIYNCMAVYIMNYYPYNFPFFD